MKIPFLIRRPAILRFGTCDLPGFNKVDDKEIVIHTGTIDSLKMASAITRAMQKRGNKS